MRPRGLKTFDSGEALIGSGEIDALIVATPHFQHTTLGIAALEAGLHVMVEKPISAHKADAERLIATANARPELTFSGMFQMRVEPRYQKLRKLVRDGELGDLIRVIWIMTDCSGLRRIIKAATGAPRGRAKAAAYCSTNAFIS